MATNFPGALDTATQFPSQTDLTTDTLGTNPHSRLHDDIGKAILALEAKVGITASADTNSIDYKINHLPTIPTGVLMPYAGTTPPATWLFCDGTSQLRATYSALFGVIGTTYGAADGTHFNLPDLRGRMVVGRDDMGGTAQNRITAAVCGVNGTALGAVGGNQLLHAHSHPQNPHNHLQNQHSHPITDVQHDHDADVGIDFVYSIPGGGGGVGLVFPGSGMALSNNTTKAAYSGINSTNQITAVNQVQTATNQDTGGGASQNVPPIIVMNYIIKV